MLKILIAEDEELERQVLRLIIEKRENDFEIVGEVDSGNEAVMMAQKLCPDIVLMDIKMIGMDGLEAASMIKTVQPEVEILILTAHSKFSYAQKAISLNISGYLLKPIQPQELLEVLDKIKVKIETRKAKLNEERMLHQQLSITIPFAWKGFLHDLMRGKVKQRESTKFAGLLGVNVLPNQALIIRLDLSADNLSGKENLEKIKNEITQMIEQATEQIKGRIIADYDEERVAVLLPGGQGKAVTKESTITLAKEIMEKVVATTGFVVSVGIGNPCNDHENIEKSLKEAVYAEQLKFLFGGKQVVHYDDLTCMDWNLAFPFLEEEELIKQLKALNQEKSIEALQKLNSKFLNQAVKPCLESHVAFMYELLVVISRTAVASGAEASKVNVLKNRLVKKLVVIKTLSDLNNWGTNMICSMLNLIKEALNNSTNQKIIFQAKQYINENYQKPITLVQVAEFVHLSPSYFSRLFKRVTKTNFVEYLNKVRINEAKRLLKTTCLDIEEISGLVGYNAHNYFTTVFKHNEGVTPSEYRLIHLKAGKR